MHSSAVGVLFPTLGPSTHLTFVHPLFPTHIQKQTQFSMPSLSHVWRSAKRKHKGDEGVRETKTKQWKAKPKTTKVRRVWKLRINYLALLRRESKARRKKNNDVKVCEWQSGQFGAFWAVFDIRPSPGGWIGFHKNQQRLNCMCG